MVTDPVGGVPLDDVATPVAELGRASESPWWFQLYVQSDRDFTARLLDEAVRANPEIAYESLTLGDLTSGRAGTPFSPDA